VASLDAAGTKCRQGFVTRKKGRNTVTIVLIIVVAALLLGGLWYVRGHRA